MIRVLVADDQQLMRTALEHFVATTEDLEVAGSAADGEEAVAVARQVRPDVVLMDMQMPRLDGVGATARITAELPDTRVLAITTFSSEQYLVPALQAGASGYLVKDAPPSEVTEAVRRVHAGDVVFSPQVARDLIAAATAADARRPEQGPEEALAAHERLTERELDVVRELAHGSSNAEIAAALFVAEATVKTHMGKVMEKWQVRDRVQVLIKAARHGLVEIGA
ncbi:response regulator transcription factor [Micrococcus flavus]|uniref:DNA-binding NarL/FixJ family response regulator n=1 Tax=Micrococcus flavus TaxID=384602 RepID=A0A4Y8WV51_9MICC|nr:response regulator transcription factor [Micrococcus flavus]MBB4881682.1 DNA-binding NarL/FixJ family response regulator [Micrococcus flavus]TFH98737.1 response regulator transcription factor [Micrococcus flavus]GGK54007.1 DNA-binding response regulator [Micrococcus flavus]